MGRKAAEGKGIGKGGGEKEAGDRKREEDKEMTKTRRRMMIEPGPHCRWTFEQNVRLVTKKARHIVSIRRRKSNACKQTGEKNEREEEVEEKTGEKREGRKRARNEAICRLGQSSG